MKKGREEKTKFSKILPNNQVITACRIELQVQKMTMNKKFSCENSKPHHESWIKPCQVKLCMTLRGTSRQQKCVPETKRSIAHAVLHWKEFIPFY